MKYRQYILFILFILLLNKPNRCQTLNEFSVSGGFSNTHNNQLPSQTTPCFQFSYHKIIANLEKMEQYIGGSIGNYGASSLDGYERIEQSGYQTILKKTTFDIQAFYTTLNYGINYLLIPEKLSLFAGVNLGIALPLGERNGTPNIHLVNDSNSNHFNGQKASGFIFGVHTGLNFQLNPTWGINFKYTFLPVNGTDSKTFLGAIMSSTTLIGISYRLGEETRDIRY